MKSFLFIQSSEEAQKEIDKILLGAVPAIAIDTEFDREKTFYPKLSLVQLSYDDKILVLDGLLIDVKILRPLLESEYIVKVFHSCRQDIEIFFENYCILPRNVIDLQVVASLLNLGDQVSLGDIYQNIIGKTLDKSLQKSNWMERPLSEDKIVYAGEDVGAIFDLYALLNVKAKEQGIMVWHDSFLSEMIGNFKKSIEERVIEQFNFSIKNGTLLKLRYQAILHIWREKIARKLDKAKSHILTNKLIEDIALCLSSGKKGNIKGLFFQDKYPRALSKNLKNELLEYIDILDDDHLPHLEEESLLIQKKHKVIKEKLSNIALKLKLPLCFLYNRYEINRLLVGCLNIENLPYCKRMILKEFLIDNNF